MATHATSHDPISIAGAWRIIRRGSFTVIDSQNQPAQLRGRKPRAIVAYLSDRAGEPVARERLIELLWLDRQQDQARGSLRQALAEIRRDVPELIRSDSRHVWIHRARLQTSVDGPTEHRPLFEDLDGITPEFDEWLRFRRHEDEIAQWSELQQEVEASLARGQGDQVLPLIERFQRIDPYNEDALRLAMRAEAQAGHPAAIRTRFTEMEQRLKVDLGVCVSGRTRALHDELLSELSLYRPMARKSDLYALSPETHVPTDKAGQKPWLLVVGVVGLIASLGSSQSAHIASPESNRIAVLPFMALNGVDAVLAEGIAEEILGNLSRQQGITTVGRTSSWLFKNKAEDLRTVGRRLDVRYVVEGSARREGDALRLQVALIDARDSSTIWSGRFVSSSGDAQRIEDAATAAIVERLAPQSLSTSRHVDPKAYAMYLRAKALIRERDRIKIQEAHDLLQQAVKIDPEFASAWAQLAGALTFLGADSLGSHDNSKREQALVAARKAVSLDPNLAEGHEMLAFAIGWQSPASRVHLQKALQLEPRNSQSLYWLSQIAHASGDMGLQERAVRRAYDVDPLWRRPAEVIAMFALHDGRRDMAYQYVKRLRAADPNGAIEVEMSLAYEEGDLSRVVEIGRSRANIATVNASGGRFILAAALMRMGYVRESLLLSEARPFGRAAWLRSLPDRASLLSQTRDLVGLSSEPFQLGPVLFELARTHRYDDIAALYDRQASSLGKLADIEEGNRYQRACFAALVGDALAKTGRSREAARLFRSADEAVRVMQANGRLMKNELAAIGVAQAILKRKESSLALLERAVQSGWLELAEFPPLPSINRDLRFQRLLRVTNKQLERERRETEALGVL